MNDRDNPGNTRNAGEAAPSNPAEEMSPGDYLRAAKALLAKGSRRDAYELLQSAVVKYADSPFLLSYFGYLEAGLNGKYRVGTEACKHAITLYATKVLRGEDGVEEKLNAVLYLNLGRAYLAGGKKKDAVDTLQKGLRFDKQNKDILAALTKLGIRKSTPLSFLDRSNPINALLGKILRKNKEKREENP